MNRVRSKNYPDSVCDVVTQDSQFSWYKGILTAGMTDRAAFERSKTIALRVMYHFALKQKDPTRGALFYHNDEIETPYWADISAKTVKIGKHTFYKKALVVASR